MGPVGGRGWQPLTPYPIILPGLGSPPQASLTLCPLNSSAAVVILGVKKQMQILPNPKEITSTVQALLGSSGCHSGTARAVGAGNFRTGLPIPLTFSHRMFFADPYHLCYLFLTCFNLAASLKCGAQNLTQYSTLCWPDLI